MTKDLCITIVYKWQWNKTRCHARGYRLTSVWLPFNDVLRIYYLEKLSLNIFIYVVQASICHSLLSPRLCVWGGNPPWKALSLKLTTAPWFLAFQISFLNIFHQQSISPFAILLDRKGTRVCLTQCRFTWFVIVDKICDRLTNLKWIGDDRVFFPPFLCYLMAVHKTSVLNVKGSIFSCGRYQGS